MAKPVKIAILADARDATAGFAAAGAAAQDTGSKFEGVATKSDQLASTSSQVAGGLGDLGGALSTLPGPLGALGTAMESSQAAIMGITGASDLLNAVTEKFPALAGRQAGATKAATKATGAATKATRLLRLAMVTLPIFALIALIVLLVVHWDKVKAVIGKVAGAIAAFIPRAVAKIREFVGKVAGLFSDVVGKIREIGSDIIRGLWDGLNAMKDWIKSKIIALVKAILPGPVEKILGISSPSKLFRQYGEFTGQGLALGIERSYGRVSRAASGLAGAVADSFGAPELGIGAAGFTGSGRLGGDTVNINVSVPATANPAEAGRAVVHAIEAYYRAGGRTVAVR